MQVADVKFHFTGDKWWLKRGDAECPVWTARLLELTPHEYLSNMVGKTIEDPDGVFCRILGVESYASPYLGPNTPIGLLLEPLERPF
jgi:hypothetical protein